jgi:hypothetical protein
MGLLPGFLSTISQFKWDSPRFPVEGTAFLGVSLRPNAGSHPKMRDFTTVIPKDPWKANADDTTGWYTDIIRTADQNRPSPPVTGISFPLFLYNDERKPV